MIKYIIFSAIILIIFIVIIMILFNNNNYNKETFYVPINTIDEANARLTELNNYINDTTTQIQDLSDKSALTSQYISDRKITLNKLISDKNNIEKQIELLKNSQYSVSHSIPSTPSIPLFTHLSTSDYIPPSTSNYIPPSSTPASICTPTSIPYYVSGAIASNGGYCICNQNI